MLFIAKVDFETIDQQQRIQFIVLEQIEQVMSFPVENETFKFYSLVHNRLEKYLKDKPLNKCVYNRIIINSINGRFLVKSFTDNMSETAMRRFNEAFDTSVKISQGKVVKFHSEIYDYVDHVRSIPQGYFSVLP